ncbi:MAG: hypothetical protein GX131_13390 [candidate division WS1 bacterium]|jgi:hypothetical protein|nr:hypothetical protein [candidate division WS1 bacterium]
MPTIDYDKLRQLETEPLIEFEEQVRDKMRREIEAKKRDEGGKKGKKKGRR